jgi:hypothetical protein
MSSDKFAAERGTAAELIELNRVVRPPEAEKLSGLSWDSLRRLRGEHVVQLGKKAVGMRVKHALGLPESTA